VDKEDIEMLLFIESMLH